MPVSICLNMIVKNEAERIARCLASALPFITSGVICDTGSTDNTKDVIKTIFEAAGKPVKIVDAPFVDWSQARNAALKAAHIYGAADYFLLMDADMELTVFDPTVFDALTETAYALYQRMGTTVYQNLRLLRSDQTCQYKGVTHEYMDTAPSGVLPTDKVMFADYADGANRPNKFKRDIRLLKAGLKAEPNNERYFYYLAQSYRDAGKYEDAIKWYTKRVAAGGWPEEQWSAQSSLAECHLALGHEGEFLKQMNKAWAMRPTRAEAPYAIARFCREHDMQPAAMAAAEAAISIPMTPDSLFVNEYAYNVGPLEEMSICGFYVPGKKEKGFQITDNLSITPGPFAGPRDTARSNMFWYLPRLVDLAPTFKSQKIDFKPEEGWCALNPSVTLHNGTLHAIIRTVNYRIDEHGQYLIRATDGTANATNPINTRNFMVTFNTGDLSMKDPVEVIAPRGMPVEFPLVVGFEDMRLFSFDNRLWTSSTVRQLHKDGNCEQVLAQLGEFYSIQGYHRMLREPRETQKNWAPIAECYNIRFMWRPGEVVDRDGKTLIKHETGLCVDRLSGSSQIVPFGNDWIAVLHEAQPLPGESYKRYYYHRFARYDRDFRLISLSKPFVFEEKVIEFCAGMCWHPDGERLVISYGSKDCEAKIATVHSDDVRKLLWTSK